MKHIKRIKIDIDKKNFKVIPSVQFDNARFLHINLVNGSMLFDLTGCSVKISGTKPDGTIIFNNCTIINEKEGFIEVELTEQINAVPGIVKCELKLYDGNGVLTTKNFDIEVSASATANGITSSNEFKALTDALKVVQGIDNKADKEKVEEKFGEVYEQLDTVANKITVRKLKPAFGTSVFWGDISADGIAYIPSDEQIINELKGIEELQVDTIIGSVHIGYKDGNLFLAENLSHLLPIVKANLKNVKMTALKIHIVRISQATITEMGETFKTQYKNLVSSILDSFSMFDTIKYVYHLNEMDWLYKDTNYHQFISDLNTIVRNRGYKAGITNAGIYNIKFTPDTVYNSIDVIGINHYPALSFSGNEITKEEALNAWRNDNILGFCKELKNQFPNMEITITESGVMDYWIALSRPSYYSWTEEQKIATGGKAPNVYLWGLLNLLNNDVVSNIWWLYDLNYPNETNNTINYFLRGGELNNDIIK